MLLAVDDRRSFRYLDKISGVVMTDDLVENVFSEFRIGGNRDNVLIISLLFYLFWKVS